MSTDVKWMDAAALDGLPRNADCLDDDQYAALRSQALAALALRDELAEDEALRNRMGDILTLTVNALKGEPDPRSLHDWATLPEVARTLVSEMAECRALVQLHMDDSAVNAREADDLRAKLAQAQMEGGVWRCSCCGELRDESASWRWNGERWEHQCAESLPQAGHMPAECSGFVMPHASVVDLMFRLAQAEQERDSHQRVCMRVMTALAAAQAESVRLREAGRDLRLMATTQATADHPLIVAWDRANADPGSLAALREMLTPAPSDGDKEKGWAVSYKFVSELADAAASAGDATSLEQVHAVLLALRTRLLPEQGGPS